MFVLAVRSRWRNRNTVFHFRSARDNRGVFVSILGAYLLPNAPNFMRNLILKPMPKHILPQTTNFMSHEGNRRSHFSIFSTLDRPPRAPRLEFRSILDQCWAIFLVFYLFFVDAVFNHFLHHSTDVDEAPDQNGSAIDKAPSWNSPVPVPEAGGRVAGRPKASR